ncbi:hypothetical protein K491DRAFT_682470 [Lophiostoma macrostomum CBS 122681]|uniref:RRM domain-containing protein n=1 Tax=Lophiostoma macrostomum CBS 122681 TaxID=1314788 RepID=A0A6A6SXA0_9PLEO|nr:hypothetical protein K491DRAFT_682470 [Lophiostoma macrostomum CBS 122681]
MRMPSSQLRSTPEIGRLIHGNTSIALAHHRYPISSPHHFKNYRLAMEPLYPSIHYPDRTEDRDRSDPPPNRKQKRTANPLSPYNIHGRVIELGNLHPDTEDLEICDFFGTELDVLDIFPKRISRIADERVTVHALMKSREDVDKARSALVDKPLRGRPVAVRRPSTKWRFYIKDNEFDTQQMRYWYILQDRNSRRWHPNSELRQEDRDDEQDPTKSSAPIPAMSQTVAKDLKLLEPQQRRRIEDLIEVLARANVLETDDSEKRTVALRAGLSWTSTINNSYGASTPPEPHDEIQERVEKYKRTIPRLPIVIGDQRRANQPSPGRPADESRYKHLFRDWVPNISEQSFYKEGKYGSRELSIPGLRDHRLVTSKPEALATAETIISQSDSKQSKERDQRRDSFHGDGDDT